MTLEDLVEALSTSAIPAQPGWTLVRAQWPETEETAERLEPLLVEEPIIGWLVGLRDNGYVSPITARNEALEGRDAVAPAVKRPDGSYFHTELGAAELPDEAALVDCFMAWRYDYDAERMAFRDEAAAEAARATSVRLTFPGSDSAE